MTHRISACYHRALTLSLGFPPTEAPSAPFNQQHRHSSISSQSSPFVNLNSPYVRHQSPQPNLPFRAVRIHTRARLRPWHIPVLTALPCRHTRNIILLAIARFMVSVILLSHRVFQLISYRVDGPTPRSHLDPPSMTAIPRTQAPRYVASINVSYPVPLF